MADPQALMLAFLSGHAGDAARVIEALPLEDAAALFAELPARTAAPVMCSLAPSTAASLCSLLTDGQALALLAEMGSQAAVAVLRQLPTPRRHALLQRLPTPIAVASRLLLGFPGDSVGAWTDTGIISAPRTADCASVLARLRREARIDVQVVHVVDEERRLQGVVPLHALLRAGDTVAIGSLAERCPAVLSAMMPIASAARLEAWRNAPALPVVDRAQRLHGVLPHTRLVQLEQDRLRRAEAPAGASPLGILAAGYWSIVSGLASAAIGLLPATGRVLQEDE